MIYARSNLIEQNICSYLINSRYVKWTIIPYVYKVISNWFRISHVREEKEALTDSIFVLHTFRIHKTTDKCGKDIQYQSNAVEFPPNERIYLEHSFWNEMRYSYYKYLHEIYGSYTYYIGSYNICSTFIYIFIGWFDLPIRTIFRLNFWLYNSIMCLNV